MKVIKCEIRLISLPVEKQGLPAVSNKHVPGLIIERKLQAIAALIYINFDSPFFFLMLLY